MAKLRLLWPYQHEDKTTWKYLGFHSLRTSDEQILFKQWIENPDFKYGHLEQRKCKCGRTIQK